LPKWWSRDCLHVAALAFVISVTLFAGMRDGTPMPTLFTWAAMPDFNRRGLLFR
jgi:hypothetical protein